MTKTIIRLWLNHSFCFFWDTDSVTTEGGHYSERLHPGVDANPHKRTLHAETSHSRPSEQHKK